VERPPYAQIFAPTALLWALRKINARGIMRRISPFAKATPGGLATAHRDPHLFNKAQTGMCR